MADNLKGYSSEEVLNKVLNTSNDSLKVDIVSGAEYAEDSSHTDADTGNFVLGVRNDALAALGGTDGDYVPFQMNASGALYVEVASSSLDDSVYVDDADWTDSTSKHTLVGGLYQSSPQSITDGDTGPLQVNANGNLIVDLSATDNAVLDAMVVDLAAIEILITSTNSKIDTFDAVLDNILTKNTEIDAVLDTIDADTGSIKTAVEIMDDWDDSNYANVNANIAGTDIVGGAGSVASGVQRVTLASDDPAVAKLGEIETTNNANQVLLGTIDSDTDATKTATEATQAALEKMLYGNALVVTAVHAGSDQALGATYESLYIGVGGNVVVTMVGTGNFTFLNVASGQLLPIRITHVIASNTTATNMIALKA